MELEEKTKSKMCTVLGPTPKNQFGPKAKTNIPAFNQEFLNADSNKKLEWSRRPENVLVVKKIDVDTTAPFKKCVEILIKKFNLSVYVEKSVLGDEVLLEDCSFSCILKVLKVFEKGNRSTSSIDLIICLGGDGTLLYAASLFQHSMPPIVPFHMGSLGFMTSHKIESFEDTLSDVLNGKALLMLRSRLRCNLKKSVLGDSKPEEFHGTKCILTSANSIETQKSYLVLNDVSVHRGMSSCLCNIDLFLMDRQITSIQGDGLVISTPTGSTGYAVAAGASVVHPQVPSIMVTPICPHSLSSRPLIVPAGAELKLAVSKNARAAVNVSFDGRDTIQMEKGDELFIKTSTHPTPCVCRSNPFDDWFDSLSECLLWNSRKQQKKLNHAS